jgi:iron complex outermembrane receptor protein
LVVSKPKQMTMKRLALILILSAFYTGLFSQRTNSVSGKVTDKETGIALSGATVLIKGSPNSVITNNEGVYRLLNLHGNKIILIISYVGYETLELRVTPAGDAITIADVALTPAFKTGDDIVISASKRPEKIVNAPASIQVIGKKELEQFTGSNTFELLSKVQGVETVRIGVDGINLNARGLNNAFNNKVFHMIDGRNSMSAISTSLLLGNNSSVNKDDIERMEILLGPQTALYGPNVHNVLVNVITKDPRKYPGTTVALSAGNQKQFSGRFRHAEKINNRWAYKLTGEYMAGTNFEFYDSIKVGGGPNGVFGPRTTIPEKIDHDFRRYRGEAHVYYSIKPNADIIITAGGSKYDYAMIQTGGHNQIKGMENIFLQGRYVSPHFFANIYNAWANSGFALSVGGYTRDLWNRTQSRSTDPNDPNHRLPLDSAEMFATRRSNRLIENSQRLNAEVQYNYKFEKIDLFLVTGLSYQNDRPRAYGNTLVDSFERIIVKQYGVVLQLEKSSLPWQMRFIVAARWDRHSGYGNYFSPKLGVVKSIDKGNFRITWGQAYSMPSISWQYASNGGSFFGNREGINYIPNGTKLSDSITKVTIPLKPEQVSTWEFGYKGRLTKKLYVDISCYNGLSKNFFSPSISVGGRALYVGSRRVTHDPDVAGTVDIKDTLRNARFGTIFNFGDVKVYGLDVGVTYSINKFVDLSVKYSWIGSDITKGNVANDANKDGYVAADEKSLNSPSNRLIAILNFQNLCKQKMFVNLSARYISQYDFYSGGQISTKAGEGRLDTLYAYSPTHAVIKYPKNFNWGPLGGFTSFDLAAGYKFNPMLSVGMNITNLFNTKQREFAGSPLIRRLIMFELKMQIPNASNNK